MTITVHGVRTNCRGDLSEEQPHQRQNLPVDYSLPDQPHERLWTLQFSSLFASLTDRIEFVTFGSVVHLPLLSTPPLRKKILSAHSVIG